MEIKINTDQNIDGHRDFIEYAKSVMEKHLGRYGEEITRIEVHMSDQNASKGPDGQGDKRCLIEARLRGMQPIAITQDAENIHAALAGAAEKAQRTVGKHIQKRREH